MLCQSNWCAPRIAAHRTSMGSCRKKNDWQFSNPRIDTALHGAYSTEYVVCKST